MNRMLSRNSIRLLLGLVLIAVPAIAGAHSRVAHSTLQTVDKPPLGSAFQGSDADRAAIQKTDEAIRAAFARGDVDGIMAYHHADVIKALTPGAYQVGSAAVRAGLIETLQAYTLRFDASHVDHLFFEGNTAVEQSTFTIIGTPKNAGHAFTLKGRSMVVYVRFDKSPTGWASIREMIQPS